MASNASTNACALIGVMIMTVGCIMGIVGVATPNWIKAGAVTVYFDTEYESRAIGVRLHADCQVGLWEHCCTEKDEDNCERLERKVNDWQQAIRIMLVVFLGLLVASIILELAYIFNSCNMKDSYGCRIFVSFMYSVAVLGNLMLVMSYAMKEYTSDDGYFNAKYDGVTTTFGYSLYLALAGALLCPIGVFLICTSLHDTDDKEVMFVGDEIQTGFGFDSTPM